MYPNFKGVSLESTAGESRKEAASTLPNKDTMNSFIGMKSHYTKDGVRIDVGPFAVKNPLSQAKDVLRILAEEESWTPEQTKEADDNLVLRGYQA